MDERSMLVLRGLFRSLADTRRTLDRVTVDPSGLRPDAVRRLLAAAGAVETTLNEIDEDAPPGLALAALTETLLQAASAERRREVLRARKAGTIAPGRGGGRTHTSWKRQRKRPPGS